MATIEIQRNVNTPLDTKEAQEAYTAVMNDLYSVGSNHKGLADDIPYLYERRGLVACLQLAALDILDQRRLPEAVVED